MPLTLANNLTRSVSAITTSSTREVNNLAKNMSTGRNQKLSTVNSLLGASLENSELMLKSVKKSLAYGSNTLNTSTNAIRTINDALVQGIQSIVTSGSVSNDKLVILQKTLDSLKLQAQNSISSTTFDGRKLLNGDAIDMKLQVGKNIADKISLNITNLSNGKLFRSSITKAMNDHIASIDNNAALIAATRYYQNISEVQQDRKNNLNLVYTALKPTGGSGTGARLQSNHLAALILALPKEKKELLAQFAPLSNQFVTGGAGFAGATTTANDIQTAVRLQYRDAPGFGETIIRSLRTALAAVGNGANFAATAAATATHINNTPGIPQFAKDAANAAAAAGGFADHNAARGAVRKAMYDALYNSGTNFEVVLREYPPQTALTLRFQNATGRLANANIQGSVATNTSIQSSTTLSAKVKAAAAEKAAVVGATANQIVDAAAFVGGEINSLLIDDVETNISSTAIKRSITYDVINGALADLSTILAHITSQEKNVSQISDSLSGTINITQEAKKSYTDTNYLNDSSNFAEAIKHIQAAISAMHASNAVMDQVLNLVKNMV